MSASHRWARELSPVYALLLVQLLVLHFTYDKGFNTTMASTLAVWVLVPFFIPESGATSPASSKRTSVRSEKKPLPPLPKKVVSIRDAVDQRKASTRHSSTSTHKRKSLVAPSVPLLIKDIVGENHVLIEPNSRVPVHFENDNFAGQCLLKFKTDPEDEFYAPYFEGKKRTFEIQVQGKFKKSTQGQKVYLGLEVPNQVVLGLISKGLAKLILNVIDRIVSGAYTSFGDKAGLQVPCIMFPMENSVDRMIVTEPGSEPPSLGVPMLPEGISKEELSNTRMDFKVENTYSMSIHGMYVDFVKWQVCNIPGLRPIDLKSFWGDQPMRLVAYTIDENHEGLHTEEAKSTLFKFELKSFWDQENEWIEQRPNFSSSSTPSTPSSADTASLSRSQSSMSMFKVDCYEDNESIDSTLAQRNSKGRTSNSLLRPSNSSLRLSIDHTPFTVIQIPYCIVGVQSIWYGLNLTDSKGRVKVTIRSADSFRLLLGQTHLMKDLRCPKPPPVTGSEGVIERYRQQALEFLKLFVAERENNLALRWLLQGYKEQRTLFNFSKKDWKTSAGTDILFEGPAVFSISETHWLEIWITIDDHSITGYNPNLKTVFSIALGDVLSVNIDDYQAFASASFFNINTLGQIYYVGVPTLEDCEQWIGAINKYSEGKEENDVTDPRETYVIKSSRWGERMLFNCRAHLHDYNQKIDVCALVADLLEKALALDADSPRDELLLFLNSTSQLKLIQIEDLVALDENQALAFYLNIYHCLVAHALLFLGPPNTAKRAMVFYNVASYMFGGFALSLREIEHSILRAYLSVPAVVLKHVLPKGFSSSDKRSQLKLSGTDFRINFALNWASSACGDLVPIYKAENISDQLDHSARLYLARTAEVQESKKRVILPKICGWYRNDMGGKKINVLQAVTRFLDNTIQASIRNMDDDQISIKFSKANWDFVDSLNLRN